MTSQQPFWVPHWHLRWTMSKATDFVPQAINHLKFYNLENGISFFSHSEIQNSKASISALFLTLPFYQMPLSAHFCFQGISQIRSLLSLSTVTALALSTSPKWTLAITYLPSLTSFYLTYSAIVA